MIITVIIIPLLISIGVTIYNSFDRRYKEVDIKRNELVKEYNQQKINGDLLHASFLGEIIDKLDNKKGLKEKEKFLKNL